MPPTRKVALSPRGNGLPEKQEEKSDTGSVLLLLLLYTLQGIPLGLSASVPLLLQERKASYSIQAIYSLVSWPFSLKLLWAPAVDSLYLPAFGRRKSWLVPMQIFIAVIMFALSFHVDELLGSETKEAEIWPLTIAFLLLYFLTATQDIAVDGWALTMLSRRNVGYASTCNSVGQTLGSLVAYVGFLAFNSAEFCNRWVRSEPQPGGMLTLGSFLWFWGWVFLVTTVAVAIFKKETSDAEAASEDLSLAGAYRSMVQLLRLPTVQSAAVILLTCRVGFAAADAVCGLKLIEHGVPKETLALYAVAISPVQIFATAVMARVTAGPRPLDVFLLAFPVRLVLGLVLAGFVYILEPGPSAFTRTVEFSLVAVFVVQQLAVNLMFVAIMAFFSRVSDPLLGGTCMTLLNTLTNLGAKWPTTAALSLVDATTRKLCTHLPANASVEVDALACASKAAEAQCIAAGGKCHTERDGFYLLSGCCTALGALWLVCFWRRTAQLQLRPDSEWRSPSSRRQA
eukprot:TRINITY_DN28546_c0_g1_i1.p1 TRINITY_DN28546_c0_g1~~TRINITY_DN28546_c0_g1_i1.p1  ORF type:complete len:521 (-),score=73.87 TRINITY_DN28546_c0_g1_i1:2-1537(-)